MKYSVVIPERNERENFRLTAENINTTQKYVSEIIHVEDNDGKGTSYSRHSGVIRAKSEIIITCDAHMRFKPGALDRMAEYIAGNKNALACLKCRHNPTMDFNGACYYGADILWFQSEPELQQARALSAVWRKETTAGNIAAVMGACYGFRKSSYAAIGEPWRLGVAWGNDEETISIAMRLIGGNVVLLDDECAHELRQNSAYNVTQADIIGVWYNRIRNLYYLPIDAEQSRQLEAETLAGSLHLRQNRQAVYNLLTAKMPEILAAKNTLVKNQKVSFDDYAKKWILNYPNIGEDMRKAKAKTQVQTTITTAGIRSNSLPVICDPGLSCPHCAATGHNYKVTNTYPNNRRRIICGNCEKPYIAMAG